MKRLRELSAGLLELSFNPPRGGSGVKRIDLVVVTVKDEDGVEGLGFTYIVGGNGGIVATGVADLLSRFVKKVDVLPPAATWRRIAGSFNRTGGGPLMVALAAIDVALWDHWSKSAGLPLYAAMGGTGAPAPVYGSADFKPDGDAGRAREIALAHMEAGLRGVKPRVTGHGTDKPVLEAVRDAVGTRGAVMADANEKCDRTQAMRLMDMAADLGLLFVEEPLAASDVAGYRAIANGRRVGLALGEHLQDASAFVAAAKDDVADAIQPDLAMAGGLSPCLSVAHLAAAFGQTFAPHFLPGLFAHFNDIAGGRILLEYFPLIEDSFDGWPERSGDGTLTPRDEPGHGLRLTAEAQAQTIFVPIR